MLDRPVVEFAMSGNYACLVEAEKLFLSCFNIRNNGVVLEISNGGGGGGGGGGCR